MGNNGFCDANNVVAKLAKAAILQGLRAMSIRVWQKHQYRFNLGFWPGFILTLFVFLCARSRAIDCVGSLDASFNPPIASPRLLAVDGEAVLIGTSVKMFRLNLTGEVDSSFVANFGAPKVLSTAQGLSTAIKDNSGRWIAIGAFGSVNSVERNWIARLLSDGSADPTFDPGSGPSSKFPVLLNAIALQPDNKMIVAGSFQTFSGNARASIIRLNPDGSVDPGFDPAGGPDYAIHAVAVQDDGRILVGGEFTHIDGKDAPYLCRLLPNGALDTSFQPPQGLPSVSGLTVQSDKKVLVYSGAASYRVTVITTSGQTAPDLLGLARLLPDGSVDPSFHPLFNSGVSSVCVQSDGRLLATGFFHPGFVKRFLSDGAPDPTLSTDIALPSSLFFDAGVSPILVDSHDRIYLGAPKNPDGGAFQINGISVDGIARLRNDNDGCSTFLTLETNQITTLEKDGLLEVAILRQGNLTGTVTIQVSLDTGVNPFSSGDITYGPSITPPPAITPWVGDSTVAPLKTSIDFAPGVTKQNIQIPLQWNHQREPGKAFYITIQSPSGGAVLGAIRQAAVSLLDAESLNLPGSIAHEFKPDWDSGTVSSFAIRPDQKIVVVGNFTKFNGQPRNGLLRLNEDGSLDTSFNYTGPGPASYLFAFSGASLLATEPDSNSLGSKLCRLNDDGSPDSQFTSPTFGYVDGAAHLTAIHALPDGKIIVAGGFTNVNGVPRNGLARLNFNGSLDSTFDPGMAVPPRYWNEDVISSIAPLTDGTMLVGGYFSAFSGQPRASLAHISATGALLGDFILPIRLNASATVHLLSSGKALVAGNYSIQGGGAASYLTRFNPDGSVDSTFQPQSLGSTILAIDVQPSGEMAIVLRSSNPWLIRLNSEGVLDESFHFADRNTSQSINDVARFANGDLLLGGSFTSLDSVACPGLARIRGTEIAGLFAPPSFQSGSGVQVNFSFSPLVNIRVDTSTNFVDWTPISFEKLPDGGKISFPRGGGNHFFRLQKTP